MPPAAGAWPQVRVTHHAGPHILTPPTTLCEAHLQHVDAPVRQVLRQVRVQHHVVLIWRVAVHISAVGRNRAQLHHQGVLPTRLLKVPERGAVATAAVPVLSGLQRDGCRGQDKGKGGAHCAPSPQSIVGSLHGPFALSISYSWHQVQFYHPPHPSLSLTLRPEPMNPVDRLSHRFSVAPVSSQRQSLGLGEILRPVSSCGRFSAYLH